MKIGQLPLSPGAGGVTGLNKSGQATSSPSVSSDSSASEGVPVTVSDLAQTVSSASASDINSAKVDSVRSAIANGTYVINPGAIADKLLSNAKEMLNRPQQ